MKNTVSKHTADKRKVAVFFGGCSSEYAVSLSSASGVIRSLDREKYIPVLIGITREGRWFHYAGPVEQIESDAWENAAYCTPALLSPNRGDCLLLLMTETGVASVKIDVALPILHGRNGEDGTLQGLLELAGIPLAGCGALSSALCMDKDRAHRLVSCVGVRVPESLVLERPRFYSAAENGYAPRTAELTAASVAADPMSGLCAAAREFARKTGYPVFVKPVKAGSSCGITKIYGEDQLLPALRLAFQYDDQVILEESIDGFEVGCAVLGSSDLITGEVDEIELSGGFFDFTEKYTLKTSAIHIPARISAAKADEVKETAKRIYRALDCSGFARVDLFLTPTGELVFNEVNTIPGFTEHSRYPGMMKAAGYSFPEILDKILEQALS